MTVYSEGPFRQWQAVNWPDTGVASLIVLDNDGNVYALDPDTLDVLFGPLALPTSLATVPDLSLEFSASGPTFFITTDTPTTGHAAYDIDAEEVWHIGTDGGVAFMGYLALLSGKLYRFVDDPEPLIMLQSRNATTGALIDSIQFGQQTGLITDNVPIGLVSEGGGLFALTASDADSGFDYHIRRIDPDTLATTASLLLGTFETNEVRPKSLGRGPSLLHVGWGHIGSDQFATSYNLALAEVSASDYPDPFLRGNQGLQSDATPVVFHGRVGSTDQMTRRTFAGSETHSSVSLEAIIGGFLLRVGDAVTWPEPPAADAPEIVPIGNQSHSGAGAYSEFVTLAEDVGEPTWSFDSGNPSGMSILPSTNTSGLIFWNSPVVGVYTITYRATTAGGFDTETYQLTVT